MTIVDDIMQFWFSPDHEPKWFVKDADFDQDITSRFQLIYIVACSNGYLCDKSSPEDYLAEVILFDQFPRNIFRDTPKAFATDHLARSTSHKAIDLGLDTPLTEKQRSFLYMPFMHSENLEDQDYSVELYTQLGNPYNLDFANQHRDIILRFGRFPHRNDILGRDSTDEETTFLTQPNSRF